MMEESKDRFIVRAAKTLSEIYETGEEERIWKALCDGDGSFGQVSLADFRLHFVCARLASVSLAWEQSCRENRVSGHDQEKALLKQVMNTFETSKTLGYATVFSEYYCASQTEASESDSDSVSMARLMFQKLGLSPCARMSESEQMVTPSFQLLVEILESLRTEFENKFFEFIFSENPAS